MHRFVTVAATAALTAGFLQPGAAVAAAQTVTTSPSTAVTSTSFTAHCGVDTSIRTQVFVKYGKVGASQVKSTVQYVFGPTPDVSFALAGLTAGTAYYVQCKAYNST
jgi:hypothetical protein